MDSLELRLTQKDQEKELLKNRVTELEEKVRLLVDDLFAVKQNNPNGLTDAKNKHQDTIIGIAHPKGILQITRGTQTGTCLQCFLRSRATRKSDEIRTFMKEEDDSDNGVVPNLVMAEADDAGNMVDMHDSEIDIKKESADVDILSLSPVSSSSINISTGESENMNSMMKMDLLPSKSMMEEVQEDMVNRMSSDDGDYGEMHTSNRESFAQLDNDKPGDKTDEETIYPKENDPQQESLISQLMHTNHLVSPSI